MYVITFIDRVLDKRSEIGWITESSAKLSAKRLLKAGSFKGNMYTIDYKEVV